MAKRTDDDSPRFCAAHNLVHIDRYARCQSSRNVQASGGWDHSQPRVESAMDGAGDARVPPRVFACRLPDVVRAVGGGRPIKINVRVIAATNRDL
jgi:hypothetical protein